MSLKARHELLKATAERYQKSSKKEKQIILDEFAASTGYRRKYAIQHRKPIFHSQQRQVRVRFISEATGGNI